MGKCRHRVPRPSSGLVTTTAILADFVRNVGGDKVEVRSIVPLGADIHSFHPTPQDRIAVSNAKMIVANGGGLDDFLEPLLVGAGGNEALHLVASEGLAGDQEVGGGPHLWQNALYAVEYVRSIRDGLIKVDPANAQLYGSNAGAYIKRLLELDDTIVQSVARIQPERRHLVTFHDAFGHFASRYGFQRSAFVLGDAGEVTPEKVVQVMERIAGDDIPVVFAEPQFNSNLLRQVASDAGVGVGLIYSDVLDEKVPTYIDLMRHNVESLIENLAFQGD